jgi:hypothetical protein
MAEYPGHGNNIAADPFTFHQENGQDEIRWSQLIFPQHGAHGRMAAQTSGRMS